MAEHGTTHMYAYYKCRCDPCVTVKREANREYASRYRKQAMEYRDQAKEAGCSWCGYRLHPAALDFDHLNPADKKSNVGWLVGAGRLEATIEEIAKCQVLCANCHRIKTNLGEEEGRNLVESAV